MRLSLIYSLCLHLLLVVSLLVYSPSHTKVKLEQSPMVVNIVTTKDLQTRQASQKLEEVKVPQFNKITPPIQQVIKPVKTPELQTAKPQIKERSPDKNDKLPLVDKLSTKPELSKLEAIKPELNKLEASKAMAKPVKVPEHNPQTKKNKENKQTAQDKVKTDKAKAKTTSVNNEEFADAILKSLKKTETSPPRKRDSNSDSLDAIMNKAIEFDSDPLSSSELDAIRSQITKVWNTTAFSGSGHNLDMEVILLITLNVDGTLLKVEPRATSGRGATYTAFVESAIRAVKSASPIENLPSEKYSYWQEIEMRFDTSGMIY